MKPDKLTVHDLYHSERRQVADGQSFDVVVNQSDLTAIDLYSGIGGWGLGLKMANISVAASYELSRPACETQFHNLGHRVYQCDIRRTRLSLPTHIDVVVGSPPCTEFSLSNRGGSGDIEDGLKDLGRFLTIVRNTKPKYWILENVPRIKSILDAHVYGQKGKLKRFRSLFDAPGVHVRIYDMAKYGLPQKRLRCIVGRYPAELLDTYAQWCDSRILNDVITSLDHDIVRDPIYGFEISRDQLTEHDLEPPLTPEEVRLNRDSKRFHPIYNRMEFPDRVDRPVRSLTATCTRVSRESVVIRSTAGKSKFRRLTLRERACLQGFPVTYQFYARSYSRKVKMIGNAIPPLFAYYLGCALRGIGPGELPHPRQVQFEHNIPSSIPPKTKPTKLGARHLLERRFRATIPSLRFKSGVRFELSNEFRRGAVIWRVSFLFGNSKDVRMLRPDGRYNRKLENLLRRYRLLKKIKKHGRVIAESAANLSASGLQERWCHLTRGQGPHAIIGALARMARLIASDLKTIDERLVRESLVGLVSPKEPTRIGGVAAHSINQKKFDNNAVPLLAGLIAASWFNNSPDVRSNKLKALPRRT